jgi:hypothetical protein
VAASEGKEKWEHRLTKAGNALDSLPPAPGGTSEERFAKFKSVAKVPEKSERKSEATGPLVSPESPALAAVFEDEMTAAQLDGRQSVVKPSIAHLPQNERLGIRLDEAAVSRPAREIRRVSSQTSLDLGTAAADGRPVSEDQVPDPGVDVKKGSSMWRWRQLQKKLNKERF